MILSNRMFREEQIQHADWCEVWRWSICLLFCLHATSSSNSGWKGKHKMKARLVYLAGTCRTDSQQRDSCTHAWHRSSVWNYYRCSCWNFAADELKHLKLGFVQLEWNLTINSGICHFESSFSFCARWRFRCQLNWRMSKVSLSINSGSFFGLITACSSD